MCSVIHKTTVALHIPLYLLNLKIQRLVLKALFTFSCINLKKNLTWFYILIQNLDVSKQFYGIHSEISDVAE